MKDELTHNKKDEWAYSTTSSSARKKVKRARNKAKRSIVKKIIKESL